MKVLVIGIDGGDARIVSQMPMPFVNEFIEKNIPQKLSEDLLSRGWAEMFSGRHASETNAFYLRPLADGTHRFTDSYGVKNLIGNENVVPIWKLLNERGYSVGIQNVPTTNPAPAVNGFVVSGGGGGVDGTHGIPPGMVYPQDAAQTLAALDYVFDVRLRSSGAKTLQGLVSMVRDVYEKQTRAYLQLCSQYKPDFGFVCFRITTAIQYLGMSELDDYIGESERAAQAGCSPKPRNTSQAQMLEHYVHLDACIKELVEKIGPDSVIFTADHGTSPFLTEFNSDVFLEEHGFLKREKKTVTLKQGMINLGKKVLPAKIKAALKKDPIGPRLRMPLSGFNKQTAKAFGTFFDCGNFAGIYINDKVRFGGPVNSVADSNRIRDDICDAFNRSDVTQRHQLSAVPYREQYRASKFHLQLPDIRILKPDNCYFTNRKDEFALKNPNYRSLPADISELLYPNSGVKGSAPLFCCDKSLRMHLEEAQARDLTALYRIIDRAFPK
jgi:predicted AlkP superfamily phosphohydrolase/phosphomutase